MLLYLHFSFLNYAQRVKTHMKGFEVYWSQIQKLNFKYSCGLLDVGLLENNYNSIQIITNFLINDW